MKENKGQFNKGHTAWNKGLTKEIDKRISAYHQKGVKTRKKKDSYKANSGTFKKGQTRAHYPKGRKNPKLSQVRKELWAKNKLKRLFGKNNPMYGKKANENQLRGLSFGNTGKKGKACNFWKGGITPLHAKIRTCAKYKKWVKQILERDKKCVICGSVENLVVHHIIPFYKVMFKHRLTTYEKALKFEKLWDLNNAVVLCEKCHEKTDSYMNMAQQ